jgi:hypothetical protein
MLPLLVSMSVVCSTPRADAKADNRTPALGHISINNAEDHMVMLRLAQGAEALYAGIYNLVGENGQPTELSVRRNEGQRLPYVGVADDLGIACWVLVEKFTTEIAQAA